MTDDLARAPRRAPSAYAALLAAADPLVAELLELHGPKPFSTRSDGSVSWWICEGCDVGGYAGEEPEWPCRTTRLAAERLGVSLT